MTESSKQDYPLYQIEVDGVMCWLNMEDSKSKVNVDHVPVAIGKKVLIAAGVERILDDKDEFEISKGIESSE